MTIYLYVKTHRKTGLKYLGKTKNDPFKYKGSGVYWLNHIKKHGYDVNTEIIKECVSKEEVKEFGIFYSKLWNIVESNEWANLKEESGDGFSEDDVKRIWENPNHHDKMSDLLTKRWDNPEFKSKQKELSSNRLLKKWNNSEYRSYMTNIINERCKDEEYRKRAKERSKKVWDNNEYREKHSGKNSPSYDHTIYNFIHKSGIQECCTRYELQIKYNLSQPTLSELVHGKAKSHKGWKLKDTL